MANEKLLRLEAEARVLSAAGAQRGALSTLSATVREGPRGPRGRTQMNERSKTLKQTRGAAGEE